MSKVPEQAIVLAAGLGTRMRPLTETLPKPLIPVAGKPLIDWCLDWLGDGGVTRAVVNTSYRAAQLEEHFLGRMQPRITVSREEPSPLETGGGIKKALPLLGDKPFIAMNSDAILPAQEKHPLARLARAWDDALDFLMLVVPREQAIGWQGPGDFVVDGSGRLRRPHPNEEAPYIFTGIEIIHPRVFRDTPEGPFSLSLLWDARRDSEGWYRQMRAVAHEGPWLNVGDLAGLAAAETYLLSA